MFSNYYFSAIRRTAFLVLAGWLFVFPAAVDAREVQTKARLLRNAEFVASLLDKVSSSRFSIVMTYFIFKTTDKRGNLPAKVVSALIDANRRGVKVTVLLEQSDEEQDSLNRDNRQTAHQLRSGGVKVLFDDPRRTTHIKATVIDDRYVFIGSHNLTHSALSRNNELSVLIDSPELAVEASAYLKSL